MGWLSSILLAVLTGVVGLFSAAFVASACVKWFHISSFEGGSGYFVVINALLGGLAALVIGLVASRLIAASAAPAFWKAIGYSWGTVLALSAIAALIARGLADVPPTLDGNQLLLQVEIRLPAGQTNPLSAPSTDSYLTLGSVVRHVQRKSRKGELKPDQARLADGRWIIPGQVEVFTSRGLRSIDAVIGGKSCAGFLVPLPAHPGKQHAEWSRWLPHPRPGDPPWPETKASYRFRVQPIQPPPPPPSADEIDREETAKREAEFAAIPPDAPVQDWLPDTTYGAPDEKRAIAIQHITAQTNHLAEIAALSVSSDAQTAAEALYLIQHLPSPRPALLPIVSAAGKDLIERMRRMNATTVEQDPSYQAAADIAVRFSAWMSAVRHLRATAGGDFTTELRSMLELSRVREDSLVMRQDVRRVASYYMHEWTGLAPLPSDPKPR